MSARHGRAAVRAGRRPIAQGRLDRPCRIYAPVGTHETLLAYLVRRLLENGANTSFVNRIADPAVGIDELIADPVARGRTHRSWRERLIRRSCCRRALYAHGRINSAGLDLSNEATLASLAEALSESAACGRSRRRHGRRTPVDERCAARPVLNPADRRDRVGRLVEAAHRTWRSRVERCRATQRRSAGDRPPVGERAACLERAADAAGRSACRLLLGLVIREAGKIDAQRASAKCARRSTSCATTRQSARAISTTPRICRSVPSSASAVEFPAVDFRRPGERGARGRQTRCWPKPAEQTPLIAARCGAAAASRPACRRRRCNCCPDAARRSAPRWSPTRASRGVLFTGSTDVAPPDRARSRSAWATARWRPQHPLIAETGGQNVMIVDSLRAAGAGGATTLLQSAFDSAGQRCSALRVLCVQDDIADEDAAHAERCDARARDRRSRAASRPTSAR